MPKFPKFIPFFLFFPLVFGCTRTKYIDSADYIYEVEPNEATYQAFEISEGNIYSAKIEKPGENSADTDLFKIWLPSGTLLTFEFESSEKNFVPYIGHTDNLGNYSFAVFKVPGKRRATFVTTADGWQYFEIGDKRNTGKEEKVGGFKYWFRVISSHICDAGNYEKIESNSTVKRVFSQNGKPVDILELNFSENGVYQINIDTKNPLSDKFSFVMNCGSREIVAGNDDEDYYSKKIDPLIYSRFERNLRHLLVTARMLLDLDETEDEIFNVSLKKQPELEELEPNDTYNYANIVDSSNISGYLDKEKKSILGEESDDEDWFRFEVEKGDILSVKITPENPKPFTAEMWASSYNLTGSGLIPLRASMLSGLETHTMNMMSPFNGRIYLDLFGSDIPYSIEITKENKIETLNSEENSFEFEFPECGWKFYKWKMADDANFAEITLNAPGNYAGLYVFDSGCLPFATPEPLETTRFFVRKYEKTEHLVLGFYIGNCEQNSGEKLTFSVVETTSEPEKWSHGTDKNPVKISAGKAYQGYFDTDSDFYENIFEFTAESDGTAYILTNPDPEFTDFHIDTVVTLMKDGGIIEISDDLMTAVHFNKYSFIAHEVKAGETYTIKITPFMSESSNISAMNIKGSYILDLYIR
ncbi:hypothetical protein J5690_06430 [bacterium]|nr:hypothetical protein [bacterium]